MYFPFLQIEQFKEEHALRMYVKDTYYKGCSFIMGLLAGAKDIVAAQRLMTLTILQLSVLSSPA